jgi:hypothetical protein
MWPSAHADGSVDGSEDGGVDEDTKCYYVTEIVALLS